MVATSAASQGFSTSSPGCHGAISIAHWENGNSSRATLDLDIARLQDFRGSGFRKSVERVPAEYLSSRPAKALAPPRAIQRSPLAVYFSFFISLIIRSVSRRSWDDGDERLPLPGTLITREYKGQTLQVKVLLEGFEFEGEVYKSLNAVATRHGGPGPMGASHRTCRPWCRLARWLGGPICPLIEAIEEYIEHHNETDKDPLDRQSRDHSRQSPPRPSAF